MLKRTQKEHLKDTEKIVCAFCKGKGKDPFDQLFPGSRCQVCKGRREIFVHTPYKTCAYCHGSGIEFSMQNTCTACLGRGVISLGKEHFNGIICNFCEGSGMDIESDLPCTHCKGMGSIF
jgi:DnaJ-class molecular chaperone